MTETEIMKAFECCIGDEYFCNDCPYESDKHFNKKTIEFDTMPNGMTYDQLSCDEWLKIDTLDLINRKNAEIEILNFENLQMLASIKGLRAEAIKEFAERVFGLFLSDKQITTISRWTIRRIAKEMGVEL